MSVASATFLVFEVDPRRETRSAGAPAKNHKSHAQYILGPGVGAPVTREIFGEITRFFDAHLAP